MPLVLKSSWMDTREGTVDLWQEESLEAVITVLRFLFCETNYQQEIMCSERVVSGMPSVLLMKGGWHQPYLEDILPTHVGRSVLLGTMSLKHGTAVQRVCLMESMCVCLCVCIDQGYCYSHGCHWSCAVFSTNQPKVQENGSAASCFFLPLY